MIAVVKKKEEEKRRRRRRALPYYLCGSEMGTRHSRTAKQESFFPEVGKGKRYYSRKLSGSYHKK